MEVGRASYRKICVLLDEIVRGIIPKAHYFMTASTGCSKKVPKLGAGSELPTPGFAQSLKKIDQRSICPSREEETH